MAPTLSHLSSLSLFYHFRLAPFLISLKLFQLIYRDMNESRRIRFGFSFFFVIIILITEGFLLVSADGAENDGDAKKEENPSLLKIVCGIFGKKFPPSSWELIQGAMQKIQMKLYPPNLE